MALTNIAKPGTAPSEIVLSAGNEIGALGTDRFPIKVFRFRARYHSTLQEISGDGDVDPLFENNCLLYAEFSFTGLMPTLAANSTMGIEEIVTANNPIDFTFIFSDSSGGNIEFGDLSGATFVTAEQKAIVETVVVDWQRTGVGVGVAITARASDTGVRTIGAGSS